MSELRGLASACRSELQLPRPEEVGAFTEVLCRKSVGKGPGQSLEQDSTLGPEGSRDSTEELERESWNQRSF